MRSQSSAVTVEEAYGEDYSEVVTVEKSKLSDLWTKEDWLAIWIGAILIAVA